MCSASNKCAVPDGLPPDLLGPPGSWLHDVHGERNVTVGIAAIADDGASIAFAADRLAATASLGYLVSHSDAKIHAQGACVCVCSGGGDHTSRIRHVVGNHATVETLGDACVREMRVIRNEFIEAERLRAGLSDSLIAWLENPHSAGVPMLVAMGLRRAFAPAVASIDKAVTEFKIEAQIIVAGFTAGGSARLGFVEDPGTLTWCYERPYHTNGIGGQRAAESLIVHEYRRIDDLASALFKVYVAKRQSEAGLGVGHDTDVAMLERGNSLRFADKALMDALEAEYRRTHNVPVDLSAVRRAL